MDDHSALIVIGCGSDLRVDVRVEVDGVTTSHGQSEAMGAEDLRCKLSLVVLLNTAEVLSLSRDTMFELLNGGT